MTGEAMALFWMGTVRSLRARVSFRVLRRISLVAVLIALAAAVTEALVRAKLQAPQDRIPTALYTRPVPWGGSRAPRRPVAIGGLGRLPMERRLPVALEDMPDHLVQAVLAVEDQRFYDHHGLDVRRIGGALIANIKAGGIRQGGSTVTQQLAKNLFLTADRTPLRKLREAVMALVLEARHEKADILEAYLNEIYLGQDGARAIHGVGAAARYYLGKDVQRVNLAEAAGLAGMIRAPNRYAPTRNPATARQRRDLVLRLMVEQERITSAAASRARRAGISRRAHPDAVLDGRYFRDASAAAVPGRLPGRGVAVYTTLDAALQRAAERAVRSGLSRLRAPGAEAALLAIDPRNGEILAMVGGRDYGASQFNRAVEARRQPGSAFKPVVALAALERARGSEPAFTLASLVEDEPLRVRTPSGPWQPVNYDGRFRGTVTVREAMEQSLNVPFARIGLTIGAERIAATAKRLGIASPLRAVPSLALGSSEVTLVELVRAYGVLAAGGDLAESRTILGHARYGRPLDDPLSGRSARVVDPAAAYLVTSALEGAVSRGTGRALNGSGRFDGIAGKTGTSNDWRDAWFLAYTPTLVVGVWVGYDDGRSLGLSGAGAALPIVARFLEDARAEQDGVPFEIPDGITESYVRLAHSGWVPECGAREVFLEGTEPSDGECFRFDFAPGIDLDDLGGRLTRRAAKIIADLAEELAELRGRR
jgi:penicillin-binding protein 1B